MTEDVSNQHLSYVTHEDICSCFEGDTLLAVQAPNGTQLEVPISESGGGAAKKQYQIHLKSTEGQIYVLLVNKDATDAKPLAVQVPLPKEVSEAMMEEEAREKEEKDATAVTRRSGRGKSKATSPPLIPQITKKPRLDVTEADKEVQGILGNTELSSDIPGLEDLMSTESKWRSRVRSQSLDVVLFSVFGPLMRLSPPPSDKDYCFNLDDSEGVCDLFDVL